MSDLLVEIDQLILKFIWKGKGLKILENMLSKRLEDSLSVKSYYTATIMKRVQCWWKDRHIVLLFN
jgi:hypothetical protein